MSETIKKTLYSCLGYFSILLGVIGLFLPLMPTTCFLILAVWAFSKSNPEMSRRILQHPRFGPTIENWITHKTISKSTKRTISISILVGFSISFFIFKTSILICSVLASVMLLLLIYINTRADKMSIDICNESIDTGLTTEKIVSAN